MSIAIEVGQGPSDSNVLCEVFKETESDQKKQKDFEDTQTDYSSTEGCINKILDVDGVLIAISIAEVEKNSYKISFRSKGDYDVSYCASRFGGGGHKNASGCRLSGDYYEVLEKLLFVA